MAKARVIHSEVQGRVRIRVDQLRRNPRAKGIIDNLAVTNSEIHSIESNLLTGSVLVYYRPGLDVGQIQALIESTISSIRDAEPDRSFRLIGIRNNSARSKIIEQQPSEIWHTKAIDDVFTTFKSSVEGLTDAEVQRSLQRYGPNEVPAAAPRSLFQAILSQVKSLPVLLLLGSSVLSVMTGGLADAAIIVAVIVMNIAFGTTTERRAERAIQVLLKIPEPMATVIRSGRRLRIHGEDVVPGDLLVLARGHHVVADARVIRSNDLSTDNSALTGESAPQEKVTSLIADAFLPIADRTNMVYRGTVVTGGSGLAVVVATGKQTEIGAIQELIAESSQPQTPLQRQLDSLSRDMLFASCAIGGFVFGIGVLRGYRALDMAKTAIALAVAVVPEGLPTVATVGLSDGMEGMRAHKVLVRRLKAVETLGAINVICFDKTGTLTRNRMTVLEIFASTESYIWKDDTFYLDAHPVDLRSEPALRRIGDVAILCSEAEISTSEGGEISIDGSPTETALIQMARACGADPLQLRRDYPLLRTAHRAPGRNRMLTTHLAPDGRLLSAVKGAPAEVAAMCSRQRENGSISLMSDVDRTAILEENRRMAASGLRVLGFAYAESA